MAEVAFAVKLRMRNEGVSAACLGFGGDASAPVLQAGRPLRGRRRHRRGAGAAHYTAYARTIYFTDNALRGLSKGVFDEPIPERASEGTLSADGPFAAYRESMGMQPFVFGGDGVTGSRRTCVSGVYDIGNAKRGRFRPGGEKLGALTPWGCRKFTQSRVSAADAAPREAEAEGDGDPGGGQVAARG